MVNTYLLLKIILEVFFQVEAGTAFYNQFLKAVKHSWWPVSCIWFVCIRVSIILILYCAMHFQFSIINISEEWDIYFSSFISLQNSSAAGKKNAHFLVEIYSPNIFWWTHSFSFCSVTFHEAYKAAWTIIFWYTSICQITINIIRWHHFMVRTRRWWYMMKWLTQTCNTNMQRPKLWEGYQLPLAWTG